MSVAGPADAAEWDAFKRAAVELVENATVVGLGPGSTAAFVIEALAWRHRQSLRFPRHSHLRAEGQQATAAGVALTSLALDRQVDLTIDNGRAGTRCAQSDQSPGRCLVAPMDSAAASGRLAIVVEEPRG